MHVDASLIRADVSWESLVERHVDEVMSENAGEEKDEGGGGLSGKGKSAKVSGTDPDASMATLANTRRHEPCYKPARSGGRRARGCARRIGDDGRGERAEDGRGPGGFGL